LDERGVCIEYVGMEKGWPWLRGVGVEVGNPGALMTEEIILLKPMRFEING
jgi:hypothetical protein